MFELMLSNPSRRVEGLGPMPQNHGEVEPRVPAAREDGYLPYLHLKWIRFLLRGPAYDSGGQRRRALRFQR